MRLQRRTSLLIQAMAREFQRRPALRGPARTCGVGGVHQRHPSLMSSYPTNLGRNLWTNGNEAPPIPDEEPKGSGPPLRLVLLDEVAERDLTSDRNAESGAGWKIRVVVTPSRGGAMACTGPRTIGSV